jgi:hypothetical protein
LDWIFFYFDGLKFFGKNGRCGEAELDRETFRKDVQVLAVRVPVRRTAEFLKAIKQVCGEPRPAAADAKWLFGSVLQ